MKNIVGVLIFLFAITHTYALGKHNLLFTIGSAFKIGHSGANSYAKNNNIAIPENTYVGGGGEMGVAYLYHEYSKKLGHSLDLKSNFYFSFDVLSKSNRSAVVYRHCNNTGISPRGGFLSLAYGLGSSFNIGRYSVDIAGLALGLGSILSYQISNNFYSDTDREGIIKLGVILPLGAHLYLNNSIYVGFRHTVDIYTPVYSDSMRNKYNDGTGSVVFPLYNGNNVNYYVDYQIKVLFGAVLGK